MTSENKYPIKLIVYRIAKFYNHKAKLSKTFGCLNLLYPVTRKIIIVIASVLNETIRKYFPAD